MHVLTKSGRHAWESRDAAVPEQYRRFLWLIDVQGSNRAIKGLRHDHPDRLIKDWLGELEELGFMENHSHAIIDGDSVWSAVQRPPKAFASKSMSCPPGL